MVKVLQTLTKMQDRQVKLEGRQDKTEKELAMHRKDLEEINKDIGMVRKLGNETDKKSGNINPLLHELFLVSGYPAWRM